MKKISLLALFLLGSMSYNTTFAQERVVTRGIEVATNGYMPEVGVMAPDFSATDKNMNEVNLSSFRGKKVVLNIFPSLDTPTCALSVRQFNAEASSLENTVVLCISKDLPFAQSRFCSVEGLERVIPLSVFRSESFDNSYGLIITEGPLRGLATRAVIVLDESGKVIYRQIIRNVSEEPDYRSAVEILK